MISTQTTSTVDPLAGASRRYRLTVAYDGRPYRGWQSQAGGNTVQDCLLAALREVHPEIVTVQGSGRTDTGVSAVGQVAHFDAPVGSSLDAPAWLRALNARLPSSVRILDASEAAADFHARFSAIGKTYRYRVWTGPVLPPLEAGLAWHVPRPGDRDRFAEALALFQGRHDFRAFSANRGDGFDEQRDTWRTISAVTLTEGDDWREVEFRGDGFLYKMVRFLVGTSIWAARGRLGSDAIKSLLAGNVVSASEKAPYCAPPDGLMLLAVSYP